MNFRLSLNLLITALVFGSFTFFILKKDSPEQLHKHFLENSPYKETHKLSKKERFKAGLPPNKYYEQIYDLTIDPLTGKQDIATKIETSRRLEYQKSIQVRRQAVPGQSSDTPWSSIGPNNQAGRTRAAIFDLNDDPSYDRVIAGGISGGLWVNEDIDNPTVPSWTQVTGVPGNLSVSNIVQDPDDNDFIFVGTGESYTSGDVNGNGIYRSRDGGANFTQVFGSSSGIVSSTWDNSNNVWLVEGYFFINDLVIYDADLTDPNNDKWIYAALGYAVNSRMDPSTLQDLYETGVYRSQDNGVTWAKLTDSDLTDGFPLQINDIEIQEGTNRIWMSTTSSINSTEGGRYFYSDNGTDFTRVSPTYNSTPTNIGRTEIASSHTNSATHYVLMSADNEAEIYKTTDNFVNLTKLAEPDDADTGISATDFTRGQSFYDLEVEVDPNDDSIVYVGGIDWFRSSDGGNNWSQLTKWSNNNNLFGLTVSEVHADQHGLFFKPGDSNKAIVVNDGGVAFCSDLANASTNPRFVEAESNYITTQFYTVAQSPPSFSKDWVLGGTQDNGTYRMETPGATPSAGVDTDPGGDGAATFFDQVGGDYAISNYTYNDAITRLSFNGSGNYSNSYDISDALSLPSNEGSFINPGALDSNLDTYYSDGTSFNDTNYRIRVITNLTNTPPGTRVITGLSSRPTAFEVSPHTTDSSTLLVGTKDGNIIKITDAETASSASVILQKPGVGSISDIHFGETEDEIYVTYYNYGNTISNVFYTSTGGVGPGSWSDKEGDLPDIPVYSIQHNPFEEEEVIIGTELGIWKTLNFTDPNPTWTLAYEGMSDVAVLDMDYRGTSALDNRVVAATFGRGIYVGSFRANTNPPVSATDSITLAEGGTATTTTSGATSVLSNDYDPDGDAISTFTVTTTINGILTLAPSGTGSFTYVHDGSETTTDTFYYNATDGSVPGNTVSVTINITPVPDCPTATNPINDVIATEDDPDLVIDFSNVFTDPDTLNLTYTVTNTNPSLLDASLNTTSLTLDYVDNMSGTATITIFANDSSCGSLASESFNVTVNSSDDLPVGVADIINVTEGGTVTSTTISTTVLANDTDLETGVASLTVGVGFGAITPSPAKSSGFTFNNDGTFSYTHDGTQTPGDANTTDVFYYRPHDGSNFGNTTTVTIQITHTNDCPEATNPIADVTAMEDDPDLNMDVSSVFTDEELDTITLTVSNTNTSLLTATLSSATSLTIDYVDNMTGSSTIILYATDSSIECSSLASTSFIINVVPQNDTPVGGPDIINVAEGGTATMTTVSSTVLANDSDTEGDSLSISSFTQPLYNSGTFPLQSNGTFVYTHDGSETTTDTFNYELTDGTTTTSVSVTINITPVNDCPQVSSPIADISVNEDASDDVFNLLDNFTDAENNTLSFTVSNSNTALATVTLDTNTLTISYIPNQNGTATVTIYVDDLNGCSSVQDEFALNVSAVNDVPVTVTDSIFVLEGGTVTLTTSSNTSILDNDSDTESDPLEAQLVTQVSNGTLVLSSTGTFTYTHDGSETTTDTFEYRASEISGQDGNTVTVNITIQEVNDCPIYTDPGTRSTQENIAFSKVFSQDITDDDGNALMYTITGTSSNLLNASITNQATGEVQFTPVAYMNGTAVTTININDGRGCDYDIIYNVIITPVNYCPTLDNPLPDVNATEDDPDLYIPLTNIFSDVDPEDTLTYTAAVGDSSLIATSITSTALIIDYLPNQNGSTYVSLMSSDGSINCTVDDLFTVSISQINDAPTGVEDFISVTNGGTINVLNDGITNSVLSNDDDPERDSITAIEVLSPINGTLNLSTDGTFTYTHDGSATTTDMFTYTPRDNFSIGNTTTVTIYINNLPIGVSESIALFESGTATITTAASTSVLSNDTDADVGDQALLTASIETSPVNGTLTLNSNGTFTYIHNGSENFTDSFTYIPFDGKGYGAAVLVSITVTPTNDPPVAYPDNITIGLGGTATLLTNGGNSVLLNDIDPDGDALTVTVVSTPTYGTLVLNPGGTFSYVQNGVMNGGDSFTYKANDGLLDSNTVSVNIDLTCTPCTQSTIIGGSDGALFMYQGCDCRNYSVYVPKGKSYTFCHLDNSISISQGAYTVLSTEVCQ
ncbi:Ig-like domain-containing protein [Flavobacteriaceae bacterium]|nr:Ig-like domain-containing protein [Flavobacteriaceae bacterium]